MPLCTSNRFTPGENLRRGQRLPFQKRLALHPWSGKREQRRSESRPRLPQSELEPLSRRKVGACAIGRRVDACLSYAMTACFESAIAPAIKAYLFSLPAVHRPNQRDTLQFPFNQRWGDDLLVMGV